MSIVTMLILPIPVQYREYTMQQGNGVDFSLIRFLVTHV